MAQGKTMLCGVRQVWDLAAGACVQTIDGAHDNVIMGLINWQVGNHPWDGTIWDELMSDVYTEPGSRSSMSLHTPPIGTRHDFELVSP